MALKPVTIAEITVATAGVRQRVSTADLPIDSIVFQANSSNVGFIYVGDENTSATRGFELAAGDVVSFSPDQAGRSGSEEFYLNDWYLDTSNSGDKVKITYLSRR